MKVYTIQDHMYDGGNIKGIYSSRELVLWHCHEYGDNPEEIKEHIINDAKDHTDNGDTFFSGNIDREGNILQIWNYDNYCEIAHFRLTVYKDVHVLYMADWAKDSNLFQQKLHALRIKLIDEGTW